MVERITLHLRFSHLERVEIDKLFILLLLFVLFQNLLLHSLCASRILAATDRKRNVFWYQTSSIFLKRFLLFSDCYPSFLIRFTFLQSHLLLFLLLLFVKCLHVIVNLFLQCFCVNHFTFVLFNPFFKNIQRGRFSWPHIRRYAKYFQFLF